MRGASWPVFAFVIALPAAACNGEIEFGESRDGSLSSRDAIVVVDTGIVIAPDTGVDAGIGPDVGPGDTGPTDTGGGGGCANTAWPFARDKATYKAKIWDFANAATPLGCNAGNCHGMNTAPLIPQTEAALDDGPTLTRAIDELWAAIPPAPHAGGPTESPLTYQHKSAAMGGGGSVPPYSAEQQAFVDALFQAACQ